MVAAYIRSAVELHSDKKRCTLHVRTLVRVAKASKIVGSLREVGIESEGDTISLILSGCSEGHGQN